MNDLSKACLDEAKNNMQGAIKHLEAELTKIRAGKANPAMLDALTTLSTNLSLSFNI